MAWNQTELLKLPRDQRAKILGLIAERDALRDCLEACCRQYGIVHRGLLSSGSISCLEEAFELLGWEDPHPAPPDMICDVPGCGEEYTCGWAHVGGYRRTCRKHAE